MGSSAEQVGSIAAAKAELRRVARARRNGLASDQRSAWSRAICEHLQSVVGRDALVMTYVAIRSEADLGAFAERRNAPTVLPRVEGEQLEAVVATVGDLVASSFGVPEPTGPAVDISTLDVVCLPGLAFDRAGRRLGYGAGFYDRLLPLLRPDALTVGVGFSVQIFDFVPVDDHDRLVDLVITEEGVVGGTAPGH